MPAEEGERLHGRRAHSRIRIDGQLLQGPVLSDGRKRVVRHAHALAQREHLQQWYACLFLVKVERR